jgi:hypothetical protein
MFSGNNIISCAKNVDFIYPSSREAKQNQSVVNLMMWGRDNFNDSDFSITIEDNKFFDTDPNSLILFEDITNYKGDINLSLFIKGNEIKSILPICTNQVNSEVEFFKKSYYNIDIYNENIGSLEDYVGKMFDSTHSFRIENGSKFKFVFETGYYDYVVNNNDFILHGVDTNAYRFVGRIPRGSTLYTTTENKMYYSENIRGGQRWIHH